MFPHRLRQLRDNCNLTQEELAKELNLTQSTIAYYESGRKMPTLENTEAIADFFNVSVDYLLGRTNVRETSDGKYLEVSEKPSEYDDISKEIRNLSPESQEELRKLIELYKLRDMQKRNSEFSDDLTSIE